MIACSFSSSVAQSFVRSAALARTAASGTQRGDDSAVYHATISRQDWMLETSIHGQTSDWRRLPASDAITGGLSTRHSRIFQFPTTRSRLSGAPLCAATV